MRLSPIPCLILFVGGCAAVVPDVPVEPTAEVPRPLTAPQPAVVAPPSKALPPAARPSTAHGTETPATATRPPVVPASPATVAKPAPPRSAATPPAAPTPLDLNALKEQLKETKAIGVFTKLTLKNQVDDLLQQFRDFYGGKAKVTLAQLRRSYDLLLMKVLSLVQDTDRPLASAIVASREAIWGLLSDPKKFSTLEG